MLRQIAAACLLSIAATYPAHSCDKFKPVPREEAQRLIGVMSNKKATSLDRAYAFETLACADMPAVRRAAMEEGLKAGGDSVLRGQILLEAMMQKDSLSVEFVDTPDLPSRTRDYIKRRGGSLVYNFKYKDRAQGCISFGGSSSECYRSTRINISGDKVEIIDGRNTARIELSLQPDNTLRGVWKQGNNPPIPVRANLF